MPEMQSRYELAAVRTTATSATSSLGAKAEEILPTLRI